MPLKRKLIKVGNSRAVIIPAGWLQYYQDKTGKIITEVYMEVNNVITVGIPEQQEKEGE